MLIEPTNAEDHGDMLGAAEEHLATNPVVIELAVDPCMQSVVEGASGVVL
ncbi:MAG: hypothetical protein AAFY09_07900 [Pseudomonadota bacterium]